MASTYSNLKIELMGTGDQSGTWGTTTNTNLGTAIEEAITGTADVSFSSADVTLTLTNTNTAQTARNLRLNLTGTSGGVRNLIVPNIEKQYIINNGLANDVTVKNSTGTGVVVPAGKSMIVFNTGSNVVEVVTALATGTVIPVANGGTGNSSYTTGDIIYASASTTLSKLADVATGNALISGGIGVAPSYGKIGLTTHVSGTLPIANGGTNLTTYTTGDLVYASATNTLNKLADVATGNALISGGVGVAPSYGKIGLTTHVSGTLPVANGGTGVTSSTGTGNVVLSASPTLTGTPLSTTAAPGTNTTQIATTAFVGAAVTAATGSLGTMSTQNANAVAITGGTITGGTITGVTGTTAAAGTNNTALATNAFVQQEITSGTAAPYATSTVKGVVRISVSGTTLNIFTTA